MPFGKGSRGTGVKRLQAKLDSWIKDANSLGQNTGLIGVIVDGSFGQNTMVALATYQKWTGRSPSGFADGATLASIGLDPDLEAEVTVIDSTGGGV